MHRITTLVLLAAVATASPTALDQLARQGKFTIQQTAVEAPQLSLPEAIQRDYMRHGLKPPEELGVAVRMHSQWVAELESQYNESTRLVATAMGDGTTTVAAKPGRHDIQYLMSIKIGKHDMIIDLDTGSSDLWIVSDLLSTTARGNRSVSRLYSTKTSRATKLEGHTWKISYGDDSAASGLVYLETVTVGDLTVRKQAIEVARTISPHFAKDTTRDGLLGLGFGKGNMVRPNKQPTWFENVRPQLKQPVFTCALKRRQVGSYDFGFVDPNKYTGSFIWHPVRGLKSHWDFIVTGVTIGGRTIKKNIVAIADTGSSLWYMPEDITDAYWKKVPGAQFATKTGGWTFPCDQKLPDIAVTVSGKRIVVPGINLDYSRLKLAGRCLGGLQRDLLGLGFSLFGDTFLKGLYVVHEAPKGKQARIGFAVAKDSRPTGQSNESGSAKKTTPASSTSPRPPKGMTKDSAAEQEVAAPKKAKGTGTAPKAVKGKPKGSEDVEEVAAAKKKSKGKGTAASKRTVSKLAKSEPKEPDPAAV